MRFWKEQHHTAPLEKEGKVVVGRVTITLKGHEWSGQVKKKP